MGALGIQQLSLVCSQAVWHPTSLAEHHEAWVDKGLMEPST